MPKLHRGNLKLLSDSAYPFTADTTVSDEHGLPGRFIRRFVLRLIGTLTPTGVTVPGTIHPDGIARIVKSIKATLDGKEWKSGSGPSFLHLAENWDQCSNVLDDVFTGAEVVQDFDVWIPLCAEAAGSVSPSDSVVDGRRHKKLELEINYGAITDVVLGATGTYTLTGTKVELYYEDTEPFETTAPLWLMRESEQSFLNVSTNDSTDVPVTYEKGTVLRTIQLRAIDGTTLSDDMVEKLALLINGQEDAPFFDLKSGFLEGFTRSNFGLLARPAKGYIHLELCERNNDGSLVLTTGLGAGDAGNAINKLALRLKTVQATAGLGSGSLVIHRVEMVPDAA